MNIQRIVMIPLLVGGLFLLTACKKKEEHVRVDAAPLPTVSVQITKVKVEVARSRVEVVGTIEAVERASISSRISGQVIELPVVLGSTVKKGDLLVKISAGEISAKLLQAEAQLSQARRNLARENKLQKQGASTEETVKSLKDATAIAEAAFKEARTMLNYTTISAPFAGTVTKKIAHIGDLASPGKLLLRLENGKQLQVIAQVPEALLLKVSRGDSIRVHVPAASQTLTGQVAEVAPAADPMSRTAPVTINIPSGPDLRAGQFARVELAGSDETTLMLPLAAVVQKGQMDMVFSVENSGTTARMRIVRTGAVYDGEVEILAGLEPGETVVVAGAGKLQDGQPLKVQ